MSCSSLEKRLDQIWGFLNNFSPDPVTQDFSCIYNPCSQKKYSAYETYIYHCYCSATALCLVGNKILDDSLMFYPSWGLFLHLLLPWNLLKNLCMYHPRVGNQTMLAPAICSVMLWISLRSLYYHITQGICGWRYSCCPGAIYIRHARWISS